MIVTKSPQSAVELLMKRGHCAALICDASNHKPTRRYCDALALSLSKLGYDVIRKQWPDLLVQPVDFTLIVGLMPTPAEIHYWKDFTNLGAICWVRSLIEEDDALTIEAVVALLFSGDEREETKHE